MKAIKTIISSHLPYSGKRCTILWLNSLGKFKNNQINAFLPKGHVSPFPPRQSLKLKTKQNVSNKFSLDDFLRRS